MVAAPPSAPRRRPRRGSPERPVNARMYRGTWLVLAIPLLIAAFSVSRPTSLPRPFPPAFDTASAGTLARELARFFPNRFPGSPGAAAASRWFRDQLEPYGVRVRSDPFTASVAGYGRLRLENLEVVVPGRSDRRIVVTAHRDDLGIGPGANDNASGTAALIVLARSFAPVNREDAPGPGHTLVFLSTDGGALGGIGARRFAESEAERLDAVISLDAIAGGAKPRLQLAADEPRSPAATLVRTAAARLLDQTGEEPRRPSALHQLVDLAFPFSLYEQAPFVARGVPAVTITTDGDAPQAAALDSPARLHARRLGQIGAATQVLIGSLDQGLELARGASSSLYLGSRVVRGWAVQLILIGALIPFLAAAVDLFARCRRRRIPLAPALRSYRSRLAFWLFVGGVFALLGLAGAWGEGDPYPPAIESTAARTWPLGALAGLGAIALAGWIVARDRLLPRRPVAREEELAGYTVALLVLGLIGLLTVATNAFALIFLLPSLHAWIWLPQVRDRPLWTRLAVFAAGFAGPLLLVGAFATRLDLGLDAPWYLLQLTALGYVQIPLAVLFLGWLACAGQLVAVTAGRYAPYPALAERPPRGPLRELVRRVLLPFVRRRRASAAARRTLEA